MRKGFTLLETVFAVAIFALVIGAAMGSWVLFMHKSHRVNTQASLDMDVRRVIERFRAEMRNTARETIVFYPQNVSPYQAVGFALADDQDGDGLMDMDAGGSNILWRQTVVYHVWNHSPHQMRRTVFSNRFPGASHDARYEQVERVVNDGSGESACLFGESSSTMVLFENLFTGKLWHAEARFDGYAATPNTLEKMTFGSVPLEPGEHTINFTIVGKNPSSSGRRLRIDQVTAGSAGWPLEAELCEAGGVTAAPTFVGQGLAGAAYGVAASSSADGDKLSLTVYNDMIEECTFIGEDRRVSLSNTVVRFDTEYRPAGFDSGVFAVKLDGQFGTQKNWSCAEQTSSTRDDYYNTTNGVMRIPVMSDPNRNSAGEPTAYGFKKDGFGPVFRLYKSLYNGALEVLSPSFAIIDPGALPASGYNSDLAPRLDPEALVPLTFWQDGVQKANWAACDTLKYVDLRPAWLIPVSMGTTMMLQFQTRISVFKTDRFTRFSASRTDRPGVKLPGCWVIPGADAAMLSVADWSGTAGLVAENVLPTLEFIAVNFADGGEYVSHPFDTQDATGEQKTFEWQADVPVGAGLTMYARSGDVLTEDGFGISDTAAWENVPAAVNGGAFFGNTGRYVQFRAVFTAQPASQYPGAGGVGSSGPYRSDTPRLRRVLFTWEGQERYIDITANILKGPDCGIFKVDVDGQELVRGATMEIEIFKDVRTQGGVQTRLRSAMTAEVDPRNSGK